MVELGAQLAFVDLVGDAHPRRAVDQRERHLDVAVEAPDHLQHHQLVEIGVEQAADDRVELPGVIVDPLGYVGADHDHRRVAWMSLYPGSACTRPISRPRRRRARSARPRRTGRPTRRWRRRIHCRSMIGNCALDEQAGRKGNEGRAFLDALLEVLAGPPRQRRCPRLAGRDLRGRHGGAVHAVEVKQEAAVIDDGDRDLPVVLARPRRGRRPSSSSRRPRSGTAWYASVYSDSAGSREYGARVSCYGSRRRLGPVDKAQFHDLQ